MMKKNNNNRNTAFEADNNYRTISYATIVNNNIAKHFAKIAHITKDIEKAYAVNFEKVTFEYAVENSILFFDVTFSSDDYDVCDEIAEQLTNEISEYTVEIESPHLEIHEKIYD